MDINRLSAQNQIHTNNTKNAEPTSRQTAVEVKYSQPTESVVFSELKNPIIHHTSEEPVTEKNFFPCPPEQTDVDDFAGDSLISLSSSSSAENLESEHLFFDDFGYIYTETNKSGTESFTINKDSNAFLMNSSGDYSFSGNKLVSFTETPTTSNINLKKANFNLPEKNVFLESLGLEKLHAQGFTGKGVGVCVIDSGLFKHEDFGSKITAWKDFSEKGKVEPYDPFGHGTLVAGVLAGNGAASEGKIQGVAPDVDIIGARVSSVSEAILALQWAIENKEQHNIKVVNISLGDAALKKPSEDPLAMAATSAVKAGLVVVVAAGNEGPNEGSVSTPGISPDVITVGALDDQGTVSTADDKIAKTSSRGPTPDGTAKPDIVAPGVNIFSTIAPDSTLQKIKDSKYTLQSGSSMATPIVSGVCALLLQANPNLTNEEIKDILRQTAQPVQQEGETAQGKGAINPEKAILTAINKLDTEEPKIA